MAVGEAAPSLGGAHWSARRARARCGRLVGDRRFQLAVIAVIVANALVVGAETSRPLMAQHGGALAIATYDSGGGGGGGSSTNVDGNYGGNYDVCFVPAALSNAPAATTCDAGLVNVYVTNGSARIVGLWDAPVLTAPLNGNVFSAVENVDATAKFPAAHLIASGEISGNACSVRIDGYSTDAEHPGDFSGQLDTTKR